MLCNDNPFRCTPIAPLPCPLREAGRSTSARGGAPGPVHTPTPSHICATFREGGGGGGGKWGGGGWVLGAGWGGGGVPWTYMAQNDRLVALIILSHIC